MEESDIVIKNEEQKTPIEPRKSNQSTQDTNAFPTRNFILLNIYAFFFYFQPSSPFLVLFFTTEKGLTPEQVYEDIFPVWTYSYFFCLVILGLLAEFTGYKVSIVIGLLMNFVTVLILIFAKEFLLLQLEQVTFGIGSGSFIIFGGFLFVAMSQSYYQRVTSSTKASYLVGTVTSSILGQLLVSYTKVSLSVLFYISLFTYVIAIFAIILVPQLVSNVDKKEEESPINEENPLRKKKPISCRDLVVKSKFAAKPLSLWKDVLITYKNTEVLKWSLWSGIWIAIHHLAITYWQSLFIEIDQEKSKQLNGYMNAASYLLAAVCALIPTRIEKFVAPLSTFFLIFFPFVNGALLFGMAMSNYLYVNYVCFILYHCVYEFMNPIASVQIAKCMPTIRFGIVFSLNSTLAMLIQTIIQFTVGTKGLKLKIKHQFVFFSSCLGLIGTIYLIVLTFHHIRNCISRNKYDRIKASDAT